MNIDRKKLEEYLNKIIDISDKASKIISGFDKDKRYTSILDKTGTIGGLLKLVLNIIEDISNYLEGPEKIAFSQLLQIMIKAADIEEYAGLKSYDIENAEFIKDLLIIFIKNKSEWYHKIYSTDINFVRYFMNRLIGILEENKKELGIDILFFKDKFQQRMNEVLNNNDRRKEYRQLDQYFVQ